nr:hypothetical protein [Moritella viscosa]SHO15497.1 unnamed protein product [Moritella viscosa]
MSALKEIKQSLKSLGYYNFKKEGKKQTNGLIQHYYTASKDFKYNLFDITIEIFSDGEYHDLIVDKK